jgi:SPP1 gp7 family putative phage head morphogenesis protein
MIEELKTLLAVKSMQKREYIDICLKSEVEQVKAENDLKQDLLSYFDMILSEVLELYNSNETIYEYQVEEIINNSLNIYEEVLSTHIHDYYITASEISEEKIQNQYRQSKVNNVTQYIKEEVKKTADKSILDDIQDKEEEIELIGAIGAVNILTNYNITRENVDQLTRRTELTPPVDILTVDSTFDYQVDQSVIKYMSNEVFTASSNTLKRVTQDVYNIIKESYGEKGNGTDTVTRDIKKRFKDLKTYEAERIARTETLKAQGSANYNRLINNETVEYKQWISTSDKRTRRSHLRQDGQITTVNGTFANGLRYPGDTSGDIEEWINCRCDLIAYYPDIGMVAPAGLPYWNEGDMILDLNLGDYRNYNTVVSNLIPSYW